MAGEPNGPVVLETGIPGPKRYAHLGKRRRSYTDELFRCPIVDKISRSDLVCNHLLWRNKLSELREHLATHLDVASVAGMSDIQVQEHYMPAKRIMLQPIPEDGPEEDDLETEELLEEVDEQNDEE